jgi:acyl carrier protein
MSVSIDEICELVELQLGLDEAEPADALVSDLGAESADVMNLVATLEERYEIEVDEAELVELRTVAEVHELVVRHLGGGS